MQAKPIQPISFQYKWKVKTAYKKGLIPSLKVDVSGRELTPKNATIDHVIPHSKGGKTIDDNLMVATKEFNNRRGCQPITECITARGLAAYLKQFIDVTLPDFDGNEYIKQILKTIGGLKNG